MTQTHRPSRAATAGWPRRSRWPLTLVGAGMSGGLATIVLDGSGAPAGGGLGHGLVPALDPSVLRVSMVVGYLGVVLLLVGAAQWRRRVEPRVPGSTAAHLVSNGLVAAAAGLVYGYGWKGALGLSLPGAPEAGAFDDQGPSVHYLLSDLGAWIGWVGVVVAAGAVSWMALRERTVSRWLGVVSLLPVAQTSLIVVGLGVPAVAALSAPAWLVVTGLGLTLGRSTIAR